MAVSKNKKKDSVYVSSQQHEIQHVVDLFVNVHGQHVDRPTVYSIQYAMTVNTGAALRDDLYKILELLGYRKG